QLSPNQVYYTFIQSIVPRPVAWVLSDNGAEAPERWNLAPFSYFNGVSSNPPIVSLSIGRKPDGSIKDTALNIQERSHFVIHIPHAEQSRDVTSSAGVLAHGESELSLLNQDLIQDPGQAMPRLQSARVAFYCRRYQIIQIGNTPQNLILGLVDALYLDDSIASQDPAGRLTVDIRQLNPLSRLGGNDYGLLGSIETVKRPG
ncbi:MAG: flavin reductase family protein, partial [Anaerolineales bacterium]|nr:flavin reductase family protein [Anaerolineales bacterium]